MKSVEYYMNLPYKLEIVPDLDEGGYVARYPELPGCITVGESVLHVVSNAIDAKREWLTAALEDGLLISEPGDLDTQIFGRAFESGRNQHESILRLSAFKK